MSSRFSPLFRLNPARLICSLLVAACLGMGVPDSARADALPRETQEAVDAMLALRDPASGAPSAAVISSLLAYAMSPLSHQGDAPAARDEGEGIIWRTRFAQPFATVLRYLYNPGVPAQVVYPASLRRQTWVPGSDILSLSKPLWEQRDGRADNPLVLRGREDTAITPDTFTGSYYSYFVNSMLILAEYEGRDVIIAVSWQDGPSEVGKKASYIGAYEDWDYIYSGADGTLKSGIGWASTYMYSSCSISVFYEESPGSDVTRCTLFKWLDAGWSGINVVEPEHIMSGAERSFAGLREFLEAPGRPSADEIAAYVEGLRALDDAALRARFKPYAEKVAVLAAGNEILSMDDFQAVIADGAYGGHLTREELIAALSVNYIKGKLGKPQLAGPLE